MDGGSIYLLHAKEPDTLPPGSPLARRTPLRRGARPRWRPSAKGAAFWRRRRREVLERDAYRCQECGGPGNEVAHVVPLGMGRSRYEALQKLNDASNLRVLCGRCHREETEGRKARAAA